MFVCLHACVNVVLNRKWITLTSCALRYLQEVGYSDAVLDVKSQRVKVLLGLTGEPGVEADGGTEPMVNGTPPSSLKDR